MDLLYKQFHYSVLWIYLFCNCYGYICFVINLTFIVKMAIIYLYSRKMLYNVKKPYISSVGQVFASKKGVRTMKRVGCLYRVSTKKQVGDKDDIPMQKQACREFADSNGWVIVKEFLEKGISGFKVAADDRDILQDLKKAAQKKEFDVLLVFMFDRLGRRDDETPFIVEWFVKQGIEVWSVKEGQQCFENHVDKLLNYIRFWQANGESLKTAERVRTRLSQLTAEGKYTGGVVPFGYNLIPTGVCNKKGRPVKELVIDEKEANIVRMVFNKSVYEGYGSHRMAEYLNQMGIKTHNGAEFQANAINRMLKNRIYCGYFVSKETVSPKQEQLVIVDENVFDMAQDIIEQRRNRNDEKSHVAMRTKGEALLAGNIFCGHCGTRLVATKTNYKTHVVNGTPIRENKRVYICYHRSRKLNNCDGQCVYQAGKIEEIVLKIVRMYLDKIKRTPKERALETKFEKAIKANQQEAKRLKKTVSDLEEQLVSLSTEIGKALIGRSEFSQEVLKISIEKTTKDLEENRQALEKCQYDIENNGGILSKLDFYYNQFIDWADEFDKASIERKKMIICQMFSSIKVSRGYKIEAVLNTTYQQFFE